MAGLVPAIHDCTGGRKAALSHLSSPPGLTRWSMLTKNDAASATQHGLPGQARQWRL